MSTERHTHAPDAEPIAVTVVYLAWAPFGLAVVDQFVAAYRRHPAGVPHRLVVALNGYPDEAARAATLGRFDGVPHDAFVVPRPMQDLAVYRAVARAASTPFVCFLNSYSTPLADGWLAKLAAHARRPLVGLVGATGSWDTLYPTFAYAGGFAEPFPRGLRPRKWAGWARRARRWLPHVVRTKRQFRPFPNPHIRTNAFMIERDLFLTLDAGPLATKRDAYRFEHGRRSMTAQVTSLGLAALVVGRDGAAYLSDGWMASRTYRSGDQENLLVADNQTRAYADGDAATRRDLTWLAWGVP